MTLSGAGSPVWNTFAGRASRCVDKPDVHPGGTHVSRYRNEIATGREDPGTRAVSHSRGVGDPNGGILQMKRGLSFTIITLLGLLASVAMAMDNNWPGAALGCVASGCLFVMAIV